MRHSHTLIAFLALVGCGQTVKFNSGSGYISRSTKDAVVRPDVAADSNSAGTQKPVESDFGSVNSNQSGDSFLPSSDDAHSDNPTGPDGSLTPGAITPTPPQGEVRPSPVALTAELSLSDGSQINFGTSVVGRRYEKEITVINANPVKATQIKLELPLTVNFKDYEFPGTGGTCTEEVTGFTNCTFVLTYSPLIAGTETGTIVLKYHNGVSEVSKTIGFESSVAPASSPLSVQQKIVAEGVNARNSADGFERLSMDGDTLVVGAYGHDYDENGANMISNAGAVFVYQRTGSSWTLQQKIVGPGVKDRIAEDGFGGEVLIKGDTLFIGAAGQDFDENGQNELTDAGALYVYKRSGNIWTFSQKIVAQGPNARNAGDKFGTGISSDGVTLVIGAQFHDYDENGANPVANAGAAFVYKLSNRKYVFQRKIVGQGTNGRIAGDNFTAGGTSVHGPWISVGVPYQDFDEAGAGFINDAGAVFLYEQSGADWAFKQKIVAEGPNGRSATTDWFGSSVSLSGTTLAVANVYHDLDENGASWSPNTGAVLVYVLTNGTWTLQQKIVAQGLNARNSAACFGDKIELQGDSLAIASYKQDYDDEGANFRDNAGGVFLFKRSGSTWTQFKKYIATGLNARNDQDMWGWGLAFSGDTMAIAGRNHAYDQNGVNPIVNAGAVLVFK